MDSPAPARRTSGDGAIARSRRRKRSRHRRSARHRCSRSPNARPSNGQGGRLFWRARSAARLRSVVQLAHWAPGGASAARNVARIVARNAGGNAGQKEPPLVGVPVSAIEEFAHNLHHVGVAGSQMAFFAAAPHLDVQRRGGAVRPRARPRRATCARVALVALGAGDSRSVIFPRIRPLPALPSWLAGHASSATSSPRTASRLNLIRAPTAARCSPRRASAATFAALAQAYPHRRHRRRSARRFRHGGDRPHRAACRAPGGDAVGPRRDTAGERASPPASTTSRSSSPAADEAPRRALLIPIDRRRSGSYPRAAERASSVCPREAGEGDHTKVVGGHLISLSISKLADHAPIQNAFGRPACAEWHWPYGG